MPERRFDLGDYVEVKERIRLFYERFPNGTVVTDVVRVSSEPDGTPRVWVKALAYRDAFDEHPAAGWSWMVLPGATSYTRGSELENTETSAWGRAIGALGIGIKDSIASANEVRAKEASEPSPTRLRKDEQAATPQDGLIGIVEVRPEWLGDLELRETPEGPVAGFRLKEGRRTIKVQVQGALAIAVAALADEVQGAMVTCWGTLRGEEFTPKGTARPVNYQVLHLERIKGPFGTFPSDDPVGIPSGPVTNGYEVDAEGEALMYGLEPVEGQEPLFTPDEDAAIDAKMAQMGT